MPPTPIFAPAEFPSKVLFDKEHIRRHNPQRYEMEQIDAIVLFEPERRLIIGYKEVRPDEFWVRGHMPDFPLMPGVLMCEAAAQICSFYCREAGLTAGDFIGFGGMDNVRFRGIVRPGDRLYFVATTERHHPRRMTFQIQGFVGEQIVFHGDFIGVPLRKTGDANAGD